MTMHFAPLAAAIALALAAAAASAQTLRWAAKGDTQSMDPFSFNEGMTSNINALIHDNLVQRARDQRLVPALAERWHGCR